MSRDGQTVVLCSKGIEISTRSFMSDVLSDVMPRAQAAVLSGPSFAIDVAKGLPTAVTLACADEADGQALVKAIAAPTFRPYYSDDVLGAEIGGAVKNVLVDRAAAKGTLHNACPESCDKSGKVKYLRNSRDRDEHGGHSGCVSAQSRQAYNDTGED